jgi:hypothetical protein
MDLCKSCLHKGNIDFPSEMPRVFHLFHLWSYSTLQGFDSHLAFLRHFIRCSVYSCLLASGRSELIWLVTVKLIGSAQPIATNDCFPTEALLLSHCCSMRSFLYWTLCYPVAYVEQFQPPKHLLGSTSSRWRPVRMSFRIFLQRPRSRSSSDFRNDLHKPNALPVMNFIDLWTFQDICPVLGFLLPCRF